MQRHGELLSGLLLVGVEQDVLNLRQHRRSLRTSAGEAANLGRGGPHRRVVTRTLICPLESEPAALTLACPGGCGEEGGKNVELKIYALSGCLVLSASSK